VALTALALTAALATAAAQPAQTPLPSANQGERISDRIRALQREAARLAGEARTLVGDLRKLEIERELKAEQAKQAAAEATAAQDELRETTNRLAGLEL